MVTTQETSQLRISRQTSYDAAKPTDRHGPFLWSTCSDGSSLNFRSCIQKSVGESIRNRSCSNLLCIKLVCFAKLLKSITLVQSLEHYRNEKQQHWWVHYWTILDIYNNYHFSSSEAIICIIPQVELMNYLLLANVAELYPFSVGFNNVVWL